MKEKAQSFFNAANVKKITSFTLALLLAFSVVVNTSYASIPVGGPVVEEKVQVKYDIKFLDFETGENIKGYTVTKIDFAGNTVVETAEQFDGYILASCPDTKELLLQDGERQTIAFYYTKESSLPENNELKLAKEAALKEIDALVWLSEETREEYKKEIEALTDVEKITAVVETAKSQKIQVKYDVKFLEEGTDKDLQGYTTTKIDFAGNTVVEKAEEFAGYTLKSDATQELLLKDGERQEVVFNYTKNVTRATVVAVRSYASEPVVEEAVVEAPVVRAPVVTAPVVTDITPEKPAEKVQVLYDIKYIDFDTKENIKGYTVTKIDFAGNTVVEQAEEFEGYVLNACPAIKELVLVDGKRQTIAFYYTKVEDVPADNELNTAKEEAVETLKQLKWLSDVAKTNYQAEVEKATTVAAVNDVLDEAKAENHAAIPQVKYEYRCIDSDGKEFYSIIKIDFADNTVVEKADFFSEYILLSEKEQELTLEADKDNTVEFKYVAKSLMMRELNVLKYLGDDKAALIEELDSLSGEANVEAFLAKAAKINRDNAPKVKFTLRYIDADTKKVLKQTEELEGVVEDVLELETIEGYAFSNVEEGKYTLTEDDNREIVIELVKFNDEQDIDTFLANGINYDSKLVYENTNFTGREEALIDYVTKAVYNRDLYVKFTATKAELDALYGKLFNRPNRGGNFRFLRRWPSKGDVLADAEDANNSENPEEKVFTIGLMYDASKADMQATEDLLVKFVENNITDDMSDFDKVKVINDYALYKGEMAITEVDDPNGAHKSIINLPSGRMSNNTTAIMLDGQGICEGYTMLFSRLCELAGVESRFVNGFSGNPQFTAQQRDFYRNYMLKSKAPWRYYNHSWNQVKIDGNWYNVDVYYEKYFSKYYPHMKQEYSRFLISNDYIKNVEFRIWQEEFTENAEKNYYKNIYSIYLKPQTEFVGE